MNSYCHGVSKCQEKAVLISVSSVSIEFNGMVYRTMVWDQSVHTINVLPILESKACNHFNLNPPGNRTTSAYDQSGQWENRKKRITNGRKKMVWLMRRNMLIHSSASAGKHFLWEREVKHISSLQWASAVLYERTACASLLGMFHLCLLHSVSLGKVIKKKEKNQQKHHHYYLSIISHHSYHWSRHEAKPEMKQCSCFASGPKVVLIKSQSS